MAKRKAKVPIEIKAAAFGGNYSRSLDGSTSSLLNCKYNLIDSLPLPYNTTGASSEFISARDSILLVQKAWCNIAIVTNTIEVQTELANCPIKLSGGDQFSRDWFRAWFQKINITNLADQFFRECFLSGNIFLYSILGTLKSNHIKKFAKSNESIAARSLDIPVKYLMLNSADICTDSLFYLLDSPNYYIQNTGDLTRQLKALNDDDINVSIPDQLINYFSQTSKNTKLDSEKLTAIFYKKQDYFPFAVPMVFPVLEDINLKLQLKKCDETVARSIENSILLVTHGAKTDDGGMNPIIDKSLKELFKKQVPNRTVISDWTTKIDFIIPDIKKVLGKEKYEVVNSDIVDGLFNIFYGEQKFANILVKLRVFIERLVNAQELFINNFLYPEMKKIAKTLEFDKIPKPKFQKIQLEDKNQSGRLITQMMQLGILTAKDGLEAFETGLMPDFDELLTNQKDYKKQRDGGLFFPLVGGSDPNQGSGTAKDNGRPAGTKTPKSNSNPGMIGASATNLINAEKLSSNFTIAQKIADLANEQYLVAKGKKKLNKADKEIIVGYINNMLVNEPPEKWEESIANYLDNAAIANEENLAEIQKIMEEKEVGQFSASLLFWSRE